ncbi:MAG: MarR family transcriptional regulator [Alphaproteobacteria bacterium]|nr:MarR family transcriptional regulator [Alphaproteobacteria bacterium]
MALGQTKIEHPNTRNLVSDLKLHDGAGFLVRVVSSRATALYEELSGQTDVTPQQFGVLLTLYQNGPMTLTSLAEHLHLDRSTLGEMAKRMSASELIAKQVSSSDRRSTLVSLSAKGQVKLLDLVEAAASLQQELLAPVPTKHHRLFLKYLKLVAQVDLKINKEEKTDE